MFRRLFHLASPVFLLYYWIPEEIGTTGIRRQALLLLVVGTVLALDVGRIALRIPVFGLRTYEAGRISAYAWGTTALATGFVFFPPVLVIPAFCRLPRTYPFEILMRSFALTRSISSCHRVIWTSSPSASFALQSHTFPTLPERLVNARESPFDVTVSSITSTLLSGRRSFTFIRGSNPGNRDKHSAPGIPFRLVMGRRRRWHETGLRFISRSRDGRAGCTHAELGEHLPAD